MQKSYGITAEVVNKTYDTRIDGMAKNEFFLSWFVSKNVISFTSVFQKNAVLLLLTDQKKRENSTHFVFRRISFPIKFIFFTEL